MLYADTAATTPVRRDVLEAMWPYLTGEFGNPSSVHEPGQQAAAALADARREVGAAFGARAGEVIFTSGGTEADNLAIKGLALGVVGEESGRPGRDRHIVTSAIEHEAVLESVDYLRKWHGFEVTYVDVEPDGTITPDALRAAVGPVTEDNRGGTTLVSIHQANNEIGVIQDVGALAAVAHEAGALFHTDAVQAAEWLPIDMHGLDLDAISISGHKLGAPKGVGALLLRAGLPIEAVIHGGGQERGHRSGTENVAFAVGLAAAVRGVSALRERAPEVAAARDALITGVLDRVPGAQLTGPDPRVTPVVSSNAATRLLYHRLPGHASFVLPGTSGEAVLLELERLGFVMSSGSACAAGRDEPSHVLLALGIAPEVAMTSVRFTVDAPFDAEPAVAAFVAAAATLGRLGRRGR